MVYTDGAASPNPGPCRWSTLIGGKLYSGGFPYDTNNEMEVYALYQAVCLAPDYSRLTIHTDSKMVIGWLAKRWAMNNPQIRDLAALYFITLIAKHILVNFIKVEGHAGNPGNEQVNAAAQAAVTLGKKRRLE